MLRPIYFLVLLICIAPTLPGVIGVLLTAFHYIPSLGMTTISVQGFIDAMTWSGVWQSILLTIFTSLVSSYLACFLTFVILQATWKTRYWQCLEKSLSPLLAIPHVAFAIGFAFLLSPTGLFARVLDPILEIRFFSSFIKNPHGLGLILSLILKELPFLLLMSIPIISQLKVESSYKIAASFGYSTSSFWWKCILPQWLTRIRFPLFAIIAYSASVVDMSLILGPTNPPTFAILVWQWFSEPDLTLLPRAASGAIILFIISSLIIFLTRYLEHTLVNKKRQWQTSGRYSLKLYGTNIFILLIMVNILILPVTLLWSIAQRWRFPDVLPSQFSLHFWQQEWDSIIPTINTSLLIALTAASISLILALVAHEYKNKYRLSLPNIVIAIPILVPQLPLLFGLQIFTFYLNPDLPQLWVTLSHIFFTFPYVYLALDGPWRSYNNSYSHTALSLGKTPLQTWLKIKMPLLFPAISFAWAIGASVSLAQYLPTLMLGTGRVVTITTESVALSSGFDRRVTAIYAIWQTLLPLLFFVFAFIVNRIHLQRFASISYPIKKNFMTENTTKDSHN